MVQANMMDIYLCDAIAARSWEHILISSNWQHADGKTSFSVNTLNLLLFDSGYALYIYYYIHYMRLNLDKWIENMHRTYIRFVYLFICENIHINIKYIYLLCFALEDKEKKYTSEFQMIHEENIRKT